MRAANPPIHRPTDRPTDQPTDQPTNQPTNRPTRRYRVATSYCETSFKQYDGQFAELIAELKAAEGVRRTAINKVIFEMIRKQVRPYAGRGLSLS